jgi:prophage regulatory protein
MQSRVIRFPELSQKIGVSRTTIFLWEKRGKFPKRFSLGPNSIAWDLDSVNEWLESRTSEKLKPKAALNASVLRRKKSKLKGG